ncbi:MAG: hypothetical protein ABJQ84_02290, partial [Ekhidna sp.]
LGEFIKKYPESELNAYAQTLLKASETFQQKRYNSAKARFIKDFNQKHLMVLVYDIESDLTDQLPATINAYLQEKNLNNLRTGNLILNEEKSMLLINIFPGKGTAINFMSTLNKELNLKETFKGQKIDVFVITEDNFDIFYRTKDVSAYLTFFEKNY